MDERLAVTMNDVDLCLRAQSDTRYVIYTPDVQLIHHVSSSRGTLDPLEDRNRFIRRWDISAPSRIVFPKRCCYSARRCSTCRAEVTGRQSSTLVA